MLSVIIPSSKGPLLHKTIDSLLENAEGKIEIIPVLDGYWPQTPIKDDERIKILHFGKNRGIRGAVNAGVAIAQGKYIMRTDELCIFGKGYDVVLTSDCQPNWVITSRRYYLNTEKWEIMDIPPGDYEKLKIRDLGNGLKKFERKDILIDETTALQWSMWVMRKTWWDKAIGELDTRHYGKMPQESDEIQFKTWKAGGKLMVNKNTWFAHKHTSLPRTHQDSRSKRESGAKYAYKTWKDYHNEIKRKMISVIIPSRNERYLNRTIDDIKKKFIGNYEIIVILDGADSRRVDGVKYIYNRKPKGMRTAINQAVAQAKGEYLMKLDAHCMVDYGIDDKLKGVHQEKWVQSPRRKRFDPKKWELIETDKPDVDYMFIGKDFKGYKHNGKNRNLELKKKLIDDTDVFQGSCYFMTKNYFNKLGLLDDKNFGKTGSEAIEVCLKVRHDGGRVIVNKTTWYAHAHIGRRYRGSKVERNISREYIKILASQL